MLSSSAIAHGYIVTLGAIADPSVPIGIPGGTELLHLVDATISGSEADVADAQEAVISVLGPDSLVDAAAVLGNFEMMNRVAEGTGILIPPQAIDRMRRTVDELGLYNLHKS